MEFAAITIMAKARWLNCGRNTMEQIKIGSATTAVITLVIRELLILPTLHIYVSCFGNQIQFYLP